MNRKSFVASIVALLLAPWTKKAQSAIKADVPTRNIQIQFSKKDGVTSVVMTAQFGNQKFTAALPEDVFPEIPVFTTESTEDREAVVGSLLERASKCMLWERHGGKFCGHPKHGIDSEFDEDIFPIGKHHHFSYHQKL